MLDDRRAAVQGLKGLAKDWKLVRELMKTYSLSLVGRNKGNARPGSSPKNRSNGC